MSRIGKIPVPVPAGVKIAVADNTVSVEGPLGKLQQKLLPQVSVKFDEAARRVVVTRDGDTRQAKALHGLIAGAGAKHGHRRHARLRKEIGDRRRRLPGGRAEGQVAAPRRIRQRSAKTIPAGLKVTCPDQTHVIVKGIDKQLVGQFAAEVRAVRKPEPYKGKGIRYDGEQVRRKAGKAVTGK